MQLTRRHLPHACAIGHPLFITFRLHGSLPPGRSFFQHSAMSGQAFASLDRLLNRAVFGPRYLQRKDIALLVARSIQQGSQHGYHLHAWVIMPNHVHLLITPSTNVSKLLQTLKGATVRQANRILHREGKQFWQHESFDRLVRNENEFRSIAKYIVRNPVTAGLAAAPEDHRWSSAWTGEASFAVSASVPGSAASLHR